MTDLATVLVLGGGLGLALAGGGSVILTRWRSRRDRRAREAIVQARLAELAAQRAPDELPRAPDVEDVLSSSQRRRLQRIRTTPVPRAHKRRDGRWG